ncbi:MAG TPA: RpiB/LacA/LacB family sugar-phosphate isomerase [Anaerolineae bacterium]|nr:RpiB/LacA/LacB family sugar-phosphate isomerase [Anaerolineae bacterium]
MKIAVGSDERTSLTDAVLEYLNEEGHDLTLVGPLNDQSASWPQVARQVAEAVALSQVDEGLLFCWTGTGVSIAANKVPGVRAALCDDAETARGARLWNDANVLCLSLRRTSHVIAMEILQAWFSTAYQSNPEDDACLDAVAEIERAYSKADPSP